MPTPAIAAANAAPAMAPWRFSMGSSRTNPPSATSTSITRWVSRVPIHEISAKLVMIAPRMAPKVLAA